MNWNQLGYLCRLLSPISGLNKAQQEALSAPQHLEIYNDGQKNSPLATKLANDLKEADVEQHQRLALSYAALSSTLKEHSFDYKTKLLYLGVLFSVFILVNFIYQQFVIPSFSNVFSQFDVQVTEHMANLARFWLVASIALGLFLMVIILTVNALRQFANLTLLNASSAQLGLIIPKQIRHNYDALVALIEFPLYGTLQNDNRELSHLKTCQSNGLDIAEELELLVVNKLESLRGDITAHIHRLITVFSILLVILIAHFLMGAYEPLFLMGEIV